MQATRRLGTFHRILNALRARFGKRKPVRSAPRVVVSTARPVAMPARVALPAPVAAPSLPVAAPPARPVAAVPQPVVVPAPAVVQAPVVQSAELDTEPAPLRPMRTLEEVRADLARLRASAKERHAMAQVVVKRDTSFEATDFMDFSMPSSAPVPADEPETLFAPMPMPMPKPASVSVSVSAPTVHDKHADEEFEPTAYLDFTTIKPLPER